MKRRWAHLGMQLTFGLVTAAGPVAELPGRPWRLEFEAGGFRLADEESRPDGSARRLFFKHQNGRTHLTVVFKPVPTGADASAIRDERWRRLQELGTAEDPAELWTEGDRAFFQYFVEAPLEGGPLHQKHVHTFLVHDGHRIEVHVSVMRFAERDQAWLDGFQRSIAIHAAKRRVP